jgi:hypothetical protein
VAEEFTADGLPDLVGVGADGLHVRIADGAGGFATAFDSARTVAM